MNFWIGFLYCCSAVISYISSIPTFAILILEFVFWLMDENDMINRLDKKLFKICSIYIISSIITIILALFVF